MTIQRYDVCSPRPGKEGKTIWVKIGAAWSSKAGDGYSVKLDALPLPNKDGEVWVKLFPPKEKSDGGDF